MKTVEELMLVVAESEVESVGGTVEWLPTAPECLGGRLVACVMIDGWSEEIPQAVCVSREKFRRWLSVMIESHSQQCDQPHSIKKRRASRNTYRQETLPGFDL